MATQISSARSPACHSVGQYQVAVTGEICLQLSHQLAAFAGLVAEHRADR
jgi:hypothetical protein